MERAAVLIGVARTGGLPQLQAVQGGLQKVQEWAAAQPGMLDPRSNQPRVDVLSDAGGAPVTADQVKRAIARWVNDGSIEQLFVYFAGHGANVRYGEFWLLSGAPDDANEAVNVEGSVPLARQCGIPHVVLVSDACRTAAASIQSQAVTGTVVFPNNPPANAPGCVDVFYATIVGKPALEVADPNAAVKFQAIYTTGLVDGLGGKAKVDEEEDRGQVVRRVRPWSLKRYLLTAIPALLTQQGVNLGVSQTPDAIITSDPERWLAQLAATGTTRGRATRGGGAPPPAPPAPASAAPAPESLATASERALRGALAGVTGAPALPAPPQPPPAPPPAEGRRTRSRSAVPAAEPSTPTRAASSDADVFRETFDRTGVDSRPLHFESHCGFKVNGIGIHDVISAAGQVDVLDAPNGLVRFWNVPKPATNVLVVFADGRGALIPAIPDFVTVLTYEDDGDGELANVTYEPSDNTQRWAELQGQLPALRELRRVVATAARLGVFRPEAIEDREGFINQLRSAKGLEPTMAVYAAYALHSLQQRRTIEEMQGDFRGNLGLSLFDVAMLASPPGGARKPVAPDVYPAVPLLSQGWALLDSYGVELPQSLDGKLYAQLESSLWTLFKSAGVSLLRDAITNREVR